jgi:hypothetical protein
LVLPFLFVQAARADGKFFSPLEVADEPGIRAQRAVIAFKDGVETLIVQSDVNAAGTSLGWLLPLPAEPTSIEACPANSLSALSGVARPDVLRSHTEFIIASVLLMLLIVLGCLSHLYEKEHPRVRVSRMMVILGVALGLALVGLFLPSLGTAGASARADVEVLQAVRAGIYDVSVITGRTGAAVQAWLTSNGFACPPSATAVIQDYVTDDWCFLAAKVAPEADGEITHHPLKVAFPAKEAVYPVRLTGSDGDPIQLDLYVIAERQAAAAHMRTWFSDSYSRAPGEHYLTSYVAETPLIYQGRTMSFSRVGEPTVFAMMWPGCVMTRLHGRLDATAMKGDLHITWLTPAPVQAAVHSQASALGWGACIAAIALATAFAFCTRTAAKQSWTWRNMLRRRLGIAVLFGILVAGGWYLTIKVVPTKAESRIPQAIRSSYTTITHREALASLRKDPSALPFPEAYRAALDDQYAGGLIEEKAVLEVPGDYNIEATSDGWRLNVLARDHIPVTILISSNGVPQAAAD